MIVMSMENLMATINSTTVRRGSETGHLFRLPFLVAAIAAFGLFAVMAFEVYQHPLIGLDLTLERAIQATNWGPLTLAFGWIDWLDGYKQVAVAVLGVVVAFAVNRRSTFLAIWFALSGGAYTLVELVVKRPRPSADLVHVIRHAHGFGFPSGHALFFTWLIGLLLLTVGRRHLPRRLQPAAWVVGALVLLLVCLGRVFTAEHWPSDVLAGVLLGAGWICLGLSIRKLSDPVLEEVDAR